MQSIRQNLWVAAIVYGVIFVIAGIVVVAQGFGAKAEIIDKLREEKVTTSADAEHFGALAGVPVEDARTARIQAEVINLHTRGGEPKVVNGSVQGGIPYADMDRDDPARERCVTGLTLRNSLNMAAMGLALSTFVAAMGGVLIVTGLAAIVLIAPALYWMRAEQVGGTRAGAAGESRAEGDRV